MASVGEEEVQYESDPEEAKLSLTMRRREASDDEDEEEIERIAMRPRRIDSRTSDCESDGQGAAAEYDDEESEIDEEEDEVEEIEEENDYEERETGGDVKALVELDGDGDGGRSVGKLSEMKQVEEEKRENDGKVYMQEDQYVDNADPRVEEEKKENEPFAVPTAGAFYMHDDRFRDSVGGKHRRTLGGRKLWESKDDRKWGHDKFEEMTMQERHYEEGRRNSRGRFKTRGKNRGEDHGRSQGEDRGYPRGNRPKAYSNNNQNNPPKGVRGRGPRRYQPTWKNYNEAPVQNKQHGKLVEKLSYTSSGRVSAPTSNVDADPVPARKQVFASSLSSASPPFYPSASASANKEITLTQKRDAQAAPLHQNLQSSVTDESFSSSQSNKIRGKNVTEFIGMNKLYIDDSVPHHTGKPLTNLQLQVSGPSVITSDQSSQSRVQGRGQSPMLAYQITAPHNQANRVSPSTQIHNLQLLPVQTRLQPSVQGSGQQMGLHTGGSQASSPPKVSLTTSSFELGEVESPPESSKSKTVLAGKGKGGTPGSGRGSFPYSGAQVMGASGNMGTGHGDKSFPTTPAFFPVMQFGGQHPGGIGVPAVGMAFPGYVAQPQLGLGNSEMTWLPVLAGATGALGATYPYFPVDGAYHTRPSGQTPSLAAASSKESNKTNESKPSQRPELPHEEFRQRQNKARRYTEMKFDQ